MVCKAKLGEAKISKGVVGWSEVRQGKVKLGRAKEKHSKGILKGGDSVIGKNIKRYRLKMKYTQAQLAEEIGVRQSTVANYESGRNLPSTKHLLRLAKVFKVTVEDLTKTKG